MGNHMSGYTFQNVFEYFLSFFNTFGKQNMLKIAKKSFFLGFEALGAGGGGGGLG